MNFIITVFTVLYILSYVLRKLSGSPMDVLSCGIFGGQARKGKKLDLKKLGVLGIFNIQRGTDSCGYYYNGNVQKGIDQYNGEKLANWGLFLSQNKITSGDIPSEIFLGHTRKSTVGSNSEENAHPHIVEDYVQTHNGVIRNHWTLARELEIDTKFIFVDSIILAHMIKKVGWQILDRYEGYAALAMTYMSDPNILYLYHGASKELTNGNVLEERPLFYVETTEGLYYSSLKESLEFITGGKREVKILPHNKIFPVIDGQLQKSIYTVKREDANAPKPVTTVYNSGTNTPKGTANTGTNTTGNYTSRLAQLAANVKVRELPFENTNKTDSVYSRIITETKPYEHKDQDVYFWKGRHFTGDNMLLNGKYEIDRDGNFKTPNTKISYSAFYFIRGIMIDGEKKYVQALKDYGDINSQLQFNIALFLSKYSKYPVCLLNDEGSTVCGTGKCSFYNNEKKISDTSFEPKFGHRKYNIKAGVLNSMVGVENEKLLQNTAEAYNEAVNFKYILHGEKIENSIMTLANSVNKLDKQIANSILNIQEKQEGTEKKDPTLMSQVYTCIKEDAKKIITKENVIELSETFLVFLDYCNDLYYKNRNIEASDAKVEGDTFLILKDLIKTKSTYYEYLEEQEFKVEITARNVYNCFKDFIDEDVLEMENRYYSFNPFAEEDSEETIEINKTYVERICDKINILEAEGAEYELADNDIAQDLANMAFKAASSLRTKLGELVGENKHYKQIVKNNLQNNKI